MNITAAASVLLNGEAFDLCFLKNKEIANKSNGGSNANNSIAVVVVPEPVEYNVGPGIQRFTVVLIEKVTINDTIKKRRLSLAMERQATKPIKTTSPSDQRVAFVDNSKNIKDIATATATSRPMEKR
jgi:hypothetical protein